MKKLGVFTIVYSLLVLIVVSRFNNDIFVTNENGTIVIAVVFYIALVVSYLIYKWMKRILKK